MHAQSAKLCNANEEPWYFSFFLSVELTCRAPTLLIQLQAQNGFTQLQFLPESLSSRQNLRVTLQLQLLTVHTDLSAPEGRAHKDGAINVSLSNLTLYYPAPCSSSRQSVVQRRFCPETVKDSFFSNIIFVPIPTLLLQPTLWHVCLLWHSSLLLIVQSKC